jgi:hypothetical protein
MLDTSELFGLLSKLNDCQAKCKIFFLDRPELAQVRDKNKKTRQTPKADAGFFSLHKHPLKDHDPPIGGE